MKPHNLLTCKATGGRGQTTFFLRAEIDLAQISTIAEAGIVQSQDPVFSLCDRRAQDGQLMRREGNNHQQRASKCVNARPNTVSSAQAFIGIIMSRVTEEILRHFTS